MLSRRNVRIKVMQVLYALGRDANLKYEEALARYRSQVDKSFALYLFTLLYQVRIAAYSRQDLAKRLAKLLPSEEDKRFTTKLVDNECLQSLAKNDGVLRLYRQYKLEEQIDEDTVRLIYTELIKTPEYQAYLDQKSSSNADHIEMLLFLFKLAVGNETFEEVLEDHFPQWVDDKSLIVGSMKKTLKALPATPNFYEEFKPDAETTIEFGEMLLHKVYHEDQKLLNLIEPTLKNWDADRVAVIDMILLKMAVCELLTFPSIPAKVTLNEFVEISKLYSTDKSKDFINGILDRLMKKLQEEDKMGKTGRGLKDE